MGSCGFASPESGVQLFRQGRLFCCLAKTRALLVVVDRLVDPSAHRQSNAQVLMGLGGVGLDFQGLLEMGRRLVQSAATRQSDAQIEMGLGGVGLDFQGLLEVVDCLVDPSRLARATPRLMWASA